MPRKCLRVAVIGTGAIARDQHLPYWQQLEQEGRIVLAAVCDVLRNRAEENADRFGAKKSYTNYRKLLRDGEYEIVDICTQNRWHCPMTIAALEAGANVLVEKPMAMNSRECLRMIDAAEKARRKLMVAQHMRFEPRNEKLKSIVDTGRLGEIYTARAEILRRRGIPGWGKFHIKKESLGGPLIDIGVHIMDLCVWLIGSPKPVAVSGKVYRMFGDRYDLCNGDWPINYEPGEFDVEDYATGMVRFEGGVTMSVECSWAANIPRNFQAVRILGDKSGVCTNPLGVFGYENDMLTSFNLDWVAEEDGHRREIRHFTECVERDLPVRIQPAESLEIQKIIDAFYESSRRNREVVIK